MGAATGIVEPLAEDLKEKPFHFSCQSDMRGEKVKGSPATYVPGPTGLIGCITDSGGKGIDNASTEVEARSRPDATVTSIAPPHRHG